jgi:hypothetical protein
MHRGHTPVTSTLSSPYENGGGDGYILHSFITFVRSWGLEMRSEVSGSFSNQEFQGRRWRWPAQTTPLYNVANYCNRLWWPTVGAKR